MTRRNMGTWDPLLISGARGTWPAAGGTVFPMKCAPLICRLEAERKRTSERQDLLSMCHYYNHCYYYNHCLLKATATGHFPVSARRLMKDLRRDYLSHWKLTEH